RLGAPVPDAPLMTPDGRPAFLLERLSNDFQVLHVRNGASPDVPEGVTVTVIGDDLGDEAGLFTQRFDATPGATYLLRPDHHLAARWRSCERSKIVAALDRALGH
ncbi:MAG: 3-(3-hydroxy-phenyl)propionate hydroxylase, partial [Variibacter sp.]|nr:3-(3-hydroxy-phenyl)propionate hydroxylase [Variibacter sp.]